MHQLLSELHFLFSPWNQVNKNGDRFEGDFLDRLPHGKVVFVKNPSAQNDMSDDSAQVSWIKKPDSFINFEQ